MKKIVKDSKGITLAALVITIVVIMILAGITLNTTVGKNGLITIMRETEQNQTLAQEEGQAKLEELKQDDEYTEDGVKVVADTDAPKINSVKVTDRTKNSITVKADVTETKSEIAVIRYKIGDGDWQTDSTNSRATTYTFTGLEEATIYEITVEATDVEDHKSTATISSKTYSISLNEAQKDNMVSKTVNTPILIGEDRVVIPSGFKIAYDSATEVSGGIVIEDKSGNQFVWIEVPKTTTVYPTAGLKISEFTDAEYTTIEKDLHTYTNTYRNGTSYTDTYHNDVTTGLTSTEYNELKKKMLKSVYQNRGFWIGRYEIGDSVATLTNTNRTTDSNTDNTPVIKANQIPYIYIKCSEAQELAETFAPSGYSSSLMFGVQWDLVLKYLESNGVSQSELNSNSSSWGNYSDAAFEVANASAKYTTDDGESWATVSIAGNTFKKAGSSSVILTTGASERNCKLNIYDLAGNVWEWTLEYSSRAINPCSIRGGKFSQKGSTYPASARLYNISKYEYYDIGARVTFYMN